MKNIKKKVETTKIEPREDYKVHSEDKRIPYVLPSINVAISTYYKGTALEGVMSKLEEYLDSANLSESDINYL